jgi:hypothetical protein
MRSFCRAANLRHYLTRKSNTPSPLQALKNQLLAAFTSATGFGTLENDLLSLDDASVVDDAENTPPTARIPLDPDVHLHLLARLSLDGVPSEDIPHFGFEQKKVMVGGVIYRPSRERLLVTKRENKRNPDMLYRRRRGVIQESVQDDRNNRVTLVSEKDSLILFRDMKEIKAGRIKQIFSQARAGGLESFLVLEVFHRIPDCQHDPYRQFPLLDVYLCENDPKGMTVVKTTDIVSHFASCPYGNETGYRVVLSLNRVCLVPPST